MAETSAIEWTDSTFNPWIGCTKISPACDHCYAEALMDTRHHRVKWGGDRSRTSESNWQQPRRWQKQAEAFFAEHGRRQRVFCSSLADVFDNQVPTEWRDDLWALIRGTPALDWLLLTKRPQNIGKMLPSFWDDIKSSVWLGTTVEDQQRADYNIKHLTQHDSAVRFLSIEPMLGPVEMTKPNTLEGLMNWGMGIDWVIAGGESGPQARPSHPDWFRSLRDQCAAAGVPFLFKQWGEWAPSSQVPSAWSSEERRLTEDGDWTGTMSPVQASEPNTMNRVGKKAAGRRLDGVEHNGFPQVKP
ncbi:hypothetical protein JP75_07800 [Devosia riboflavina]|uniref:Phage protein Gp37/Gp68 n=1 Tax=Devosia riboflavina TaxID=46914 RepID=A0A087M3J5_9HYPH|nr:phage Gp37/Gp68 family protein [Devosia riboflavina]KFL31448.1 hypothetical protein JP75_07800 [Devosia riboflavina]